LTRASNNFHVTNKSLGCRYQSFEIIRSSSTAFPTSKNRNNPPGFPPRKPVEEDVPPDEKLDGSSSS
jgi:hypothetical protein